VNCSSTWQLHHPQHIILVGHKFGCILIKSLIIAVNKVAHAKIFPDLGGRLTKDSCEAFLHNLSGIVFYTVPHLRTVNDIEIMFQEKKDVFNEVRDFSYSAQSDIPESTRLHKSLLHQIEAINEDFEDSIADDHTKICLISHGFKVNSLTFMLHHVLDDGHMNILALVQGHPYGKS
jgi:hypothetical protein